MIEERFRQFRSRILVDTLMRRLDSVSASVVKCFLLSSLNRFCLLFGLCVHITLVLVFCVRCQCAVCASLLGLTSDGPPARPAPTVSDPQRHRPQSSTRSHFLPPTSFQRSSSQSIGFQQVIERAMQPTSSAVRTGQSLSSAECGTQPLTSVGRNLRSRIGTELSKPSSTKKERYMQPKTSASGSIPSPFGAQRSTIPAPADVLVMFQPPYAVQDVVDEELKCAMLTIIDQMCGHDLFHRRCAAVRHHPEKQRAVPVAPPKRAENPIWGPQRSSLKCTYPWLLPNEVSELDEQLDNRMRNLWSAPPSFSKPALETSNAESRSKVRGGSSSALPSFMFRYTHDMQATVPRVVQQSVQPISTVDTVHSNASQTDLPAPIQLDISVQPLASCLPTKHAEVATASQELTIETEFEVASIKQDTSAQPTAGCHSPPRPEEVAESQEFKISTESELTVVAQVDCPSSSSASTAAIETTSTLNLAATDPVQSVESVVAYEDAPSLLAPKDVQQEMRLLLKQKQLKALLEQQEMQQQKLQMVREKRVLKKEKRQKEKKRKQQLQLQHLLRSQADNEKKVQSRSHQKGGVA